MGYPRPQLRREAWQSLNGSWECSFQSEQNPKNVVYNKSIRVPYSPETPRSGLHDPSPHPVVWYRRTVQVERPDQNERLILHFGAVDWAAEVWVNGQRQGRHEGGYTPFSFDITDALSGGELTVEVRATDDWRDMGQPRGKQDWHEDGQGHGIWYPRTSGIWQTVWLEKVPAARLERLRWQADVPSFSLNLALDVTEEAVGGELRVSLSADGQTLSQDHVQVGGTHLRRTIFIPDPGIDDARFRLMWWPEYPQLLEATLELYDAGGKLLDSVQSYTALRSVTLDRGQFLLNGRPYYLRLALDQGYWPEGGLTAEGEELRADVELARKLGFNGVRKHQKIESPEWLEWCDRLGLLVWEELPSAYAYSARTVRQLTQTWLEAIERDASHPCIVNWVPFNESWAVPDLPTRPEQREAVQALYSLTKSLDPTRPAVGNDGWEHVVSDLLTIHDYHADPNVIRQRYGSRQAMPDTLQDYRSAGRRLTLDGYQDAGQAVILSEFGGIAFNADNTEGWGYSEAKDSATFLKRYQDLLTAVNDCRALAGFCYTQLTDTYQEINGLTTLNRTPKAPLAELAAATRGQAAQPNNPLWYHPEWLKKQAAKGEQ